MADLKKVSSGEKLKIPASTYNVFIDTAQDYLKRQNRQAGGDSGTPLQSKFVLVKNTTGSAVNRFGVLGISNSELSVSDNYFKQNIVLTGALPSSTSHSSGRFVVLHEPIAASGVGRAYINGHCQVQINVTDAGHTFCDVKDGDSTMLQSADSGPAVIIWKESGTGTKWAIIRFGGSGGGGGTSFTWYLIAETPTAAIAYYKLKTATDAEWANGTDYAVGGTMHITTAGVVKRYSCKKAHKAGANQWVANTTYAADDRVWHGTAPNDTTYKCVTPNSDATWQVGKWMADNDKPEADAWADYWEAADLKGYIFAPPFTGTIQTYAPQMIIGETVMTYPSTTNPLEMWILAPSFMSIGTGKSLVWNLTDRRLMSVFGG